MTKWLTKIPIILFITFILFQNCCVPLSKALSKQNYKYQVVLIDSRFTSKELSLIIKAADEWFIKTKGKAQFELVFNFDVSKYSNFDKNGNILVMVKASKDDEYIKNIDKNQNTILGFYDARGDVPFISIVADRMKFASDEYYYGVVIHEFGHSLGIRHNNIEGTVMFPTMDKSSSHLQQADIDQFCDRYNCLK